MSQGPQQQPPGTPATRDTGGWEHDEWAHVVPTTLTADEAMAVETIRRRGSPGSTYGHGQG